MLIFFLELRTTEHTHMDRSNLLLLGGGSLVVLSLVLLLVIRRTKSTGSCGALLCQEKCRDGYTSAVGACWQNCAQLNSVNVGALCREKCRAGYKDVGGVCWFDSCPPGQTKSGASCYEPCRAGEKNVGCCLCREQCRSGYREVLGVCWKGLKSYVPKTRPRKGDGKLASYVPKTFAKKTYVPKTSLASGGWVALMVVFLLAAVAAKIAL